jgi:hypothetical protein
MFVFGITIITTLAQSLVLYNFDIDFAINAYAQQKYSSSLDIPGKVVNSKYLHIIDQKYLQGKLGYDTINGTIVNNVAKISPLLLFMLHCMTKIYFYHNGKWFCLCFFT